MAKFLSPFIPPAVTDQAPSVFLAKTTESIALSFGVVVVVVVLAIDVVVCVVIAVAVAAAIAVRGAVTFVALAAGGLRRPAQSAPVRFGGRTDSVDPFRGSQNDSVCVFEEVVRVGGPQPQFISLRHGSRNRLVN